MSSLGVGLREDCVEIREAGIRDERLRAIDNVTVAVAPRCCLERRNVRAGVGLGDGERGDGRARLDARQPAPLERLVAGERHGEAAESLHGEH